MSATPMHRSFPLVSILIPTYNRASMLESALASAVSQTYENLEVLVVNDGSTDETEAVIARFSGHASVRSLTNRNNLGPNANWSKAIAESTGDFFCFLADDDWLAPSFVERMVAPHLESASVGLTFCDHWVADSSGSVQRRDTVQNTRRYGRSPLSSGPVDRFPWRSLILDSVYVGAALFRRSFLDQSKFPPDAGSALGAWLCYRYARTGCDVHYLEDRLMTCRWHSNSVSRSDKNRFALMEGHVFRFRTIREDSAMSDIHELVRLRLAGMLYVLGRIRLQDRRYDAAVRRFIESLRVNLDLKVLAFTTYALVRRGLEGARELLFGPARSEIGPRLEEYEET